MTAAGEKKASLPSVRVMAVRFGEVPFLEMVEHDAMCKRYALGGLAQLLRLGRLEDPDLHGRDFLRRARALDRKYVYVWKARDAKGQGIELVHELWFEEGKFQFVPLDGKDERAPGGAFHTQLHLLVGTVDEPTRWYFFLVSSVQYPWKKLTGLGPDVPARAMRFPDPFWTDLLLIPGSTPDRQSPGPAGKPKPASLSGRPEPHDLRRARSLLKKGAKIVGAQVYLVDPLAEAVGKAGAYGRALDSWYSEIKRLNDDSIYTLAKRIAAVIAGQPKLANEVRKGDLDSYIERSEGELELRERLVHQTCRDLVEWIGVEMRFEGRGRVVDTHASGVEVVAPPPASDARFNVFSQMVRDFAGGEIPEPISSALAAVYGRLAECKPGRLWMRHIWGAKASGKALVADGGLSVLFEARKAPPGPGRVAARGQPASEGAAGAAEQDRRTGDLREAVRKTGGVAAAGVDILCEKFAPFWDEAHARKVFRQFGIELEPVPPRLPGPMRLASAERIAGEAQQLLAEANVGVRLRPVASEALGALGKVAPFLQLALELNNTARAALELGQGRLDGAKALGLAGSIADSLQAASEVARIVRPGVAGFARAVPVLGIIGGGVDTVTGAADASKAWEEAGWSGRAVGHGLRTTGGALAIVGGVLLLANPIGMAGAVITLVAVGAQFGGSWIVEASSELRSALSRSPWSKSVVHTTLELDEPVEQHRALSRAIYPFTARVRAIDVPRFGRGTKKVTLRVEVEEEVARWLSADAQWFVEANGMFGSEKTWRGWSIPSRGVRGATLVNGTLVLETDAPGIVIGSEDDFVRVDSATITLKPCQDERYHVVKRIKDDQFDPTPMILDGRSAPAR